jgi:hypothetical protein
VPFIEAIWLALAQIRVQKLKSFFTLLGVCIGVMFLIAVISIVQGMSSYMENDFAAKLLGVNTFTLRRFPWFGDGASSEEEWRAWLRRPRIYHSDLPLVASVLPEGSRYAVESQENLQAESQYARPKQVEAHAVDGDYFTIKKYDVHTGRLFTQQEASLGAPVVVIGNDVATYFFKDLDPLGRPLRIKGMPYTVIGVLEKQGSVFGLSLDRIAIAVQLASAPFHQSTWRRRWHHGADAVRADDDRRHGSGARSHAWPPQASPCRARQLLHGDIGERAGVHGQPEEGDDDGGNCIPGDRSHRRRDGHHEHHAGGGGGANA